MGKNKHIYAVLLAGGRGKRLWPVSKPGFSKPFIGFRGYKPPILNAIDIIKSICSKNDIFAVTTAGQKGLVKNLRKIPAKNIIAEPFSRNTAAAIGLAALHLLRQDPEARMMVLPTDQYIKNKNKFFKAMKNAAEFIKSNKDSLVIIGIKPKYPSTSFGYIKISGKKRGGLRRVVKFVEKPSLAKAKMLLKKKCYFWNAGIFIWRADTFLESVKINSPFLFKNLQKIRKFIAKGTREGSVRKIYKTMKDASIDYELLEKAKNIFCVRADFDLCDIGSWASFGSLYPADKNRNIFIGNVETLNSSGSIVYNTEKNKVGLVGVKDMIVVHTENGTLVCGKQSAEIVRNLKRGIEK